ncbi:MAG TPA: CBS domain-containing protein [Nitrososphaeraceae archaeon]
MTQKLEYAAMTDTIHQVARNMAEKDVSSIVIVDMNNVPIGLVTERDIVRKACAKERFNSNSLKVSEIMSSSLITIDSSATSEEAANLFLKNKIRHMLVIDKETKKAVGMITPMDFTRYRGYTKMKSQENKSTEEAAIDKILEYYRE